MFVHGASLRHTCGDLKLSPKQVDNAITRARKKILLMLEQHGYEKPERSDHKLVWLPSVACYLVSVVDGSHYAKIGFVQNKAGLAKLLKAYRKNPSLSHWREKADDEYQRLVNKRKRNRK